MTDKVVDAADDEEVAVEEDVVYDQAPVDEVLPVIREGDWARISGSAQKVPVESRGRDVRVISAAIRRAGPDTISPMGYEYQLASDEIDVKVASGGQQFTCTRGALVAFGPTRESMNESEAMDAAAAQREEDEKAQAIADKKAEIAAKKAEVEAAKADKK